MSTSSSFTATGGFPTAPPRGGGARLGDQRPGAGGADPRARTSSTWASASGKRIQKDMADLNAAGSEWSAGPKNDNLYHWIATVLGPAGTPYEGGVFFLDLVFPGDYPFSPPRVSFRTRIFHCNVDPSSGCLALPLLQDAWSPAMTVSRLLLAIRALIANPDPAYCQSQSQSQSQQSSISRLFLSDRAKHDQIAAEWTMRFAR